LFYHEYRGRYEEKPGRTTSVYASEADRRNCSKPFRRQRDICSIVRAVGVTTKMPATVSGDSGVPPCKSPFLEASDDFFIRGLWHTDKQQVHSPGIRPHNRNRLVRPQWSRHRAFLLMALKTATTQPSGFASKTTSSYTPSATSSRDSERSI
jgi:hypothetical protein